MGVTAAGLECLCPAGSPVSQYLPQTCEPDHCEIAEAEIGKPGVTVDTGGVLVTVDSWIGSPGNYTGFKLSATVPVGALDYDVVAGGVMDQKTSGQTYSSSKSISLINFCDPEDDGDTGGGDDAEPTPDDDFDPSDNGTCYCAPPNDKAIDDGSSGSGDGTDCTEDVDGCGDGSGNEVG